MTSFSVLSQRSSNGRYAGPHWNCTQSLTSLTETARVCSLLAKDFKSQRSVPRNEQKEKSEEEIQINTDINIDRDMGILLEQYNRWAAESR